MSPSREQIQGCLFGLALGDALGAPYEGGILERLLWKMIGSTKEGYAKWTDDTQMTLDLLESILE
ncbi:MAG TPA: ADP-ribosylglycohydrolase family protein, partial [Agitococcus sp.]|nr:ADP-ribosylglycohydrolase family protein [Agitococcus sp.]HNH44827.1 ADP-ribosylglycohydrolase family protein [Agitococcus sp.]